MRLNYGKKQLGTIEIKHNYTTNQIITPKGILTTFGLERNHSMSIEDSIKALKIDINEYPEIELFSMDFLDEDYGVWRYVLDVASIRVHGYENHKEVIFDCREAKAREDFSSCSGLDKTIAFEEMLVLEKSYQTKNGYTN